MSVDTVVIASAPTNEAPEGHDQAMIDLVDKNQTALADLDQNNSEAAQDRPEWLPEKFQSAKDLAKAYAELESKLGNKPKAEDAPKDIPQDQTTEAEKQLTEKGLDLSDFSNEFMQKGELSPESYDKLQKAGFPKDLVDNYIAGQKAIATSYETSIKAEAGGEQKYSEMTEWAKANWSEQQVEAFNKAVSSGDANIAKLAVAGMANEFAKANGSEPKLIGGKTTGTQSEDVFESTAQLTKAMADPRYQNDPAYRAKVQTKLGRSKLF